MSNCTNPSTTGGVASGLATGSGGPAERAARVAELTAERFGGCPSRRPSDRSEQAALRWLAQGARRARAAAELSRTGGQVSFTRGRHTTRTATGVR